ncbi:MFS transporter [Luminiphilus sp.]|nr:MFS transporter [Luminiphilus sp.]MDB0009156.1 MFS transporter [Luminiphilus sp.]
MKVRLHRWRQQSLAWLVFFVIVVDLIGFGIVIPILPFLSPQLGGGTDDVAFILVSYSVAAAFFAPVWGRLSDRVGRRRILGICLLGGAASHFLLAASDALWMVYLARAVAGVMAGSIPVATAVIADASSPDQRSRAMGLIGRAFGVGLILGPVIGGLLARNDNDFTLPCIVAGVLSGMAALMTFTLLPASQPHRPDEGAASTSISLFQLVQRSGFFLFIAQFCLHTCAVSAAIYLFPLWVADGHGWQAQEVGLFFGLVGVVMIVTQGNILGRMTDRFGNVGVLRGAALLFSASLLLSGWVSGIWAMTLVSLCVFSSATLCLPILNTIASHLVAPSWRGQFFGMTASSSAVGRVLGPLIAAVLLAYSGFAMAWTGMGLLVGLIVIWSLTDGARLEFAATQSIPESAQPLARDA